MNSYAIYLAEAGWRFEAMAASEEAVTLCRELVAVNRDPLPGAGGGQPRRLPPKPRHVAEQPRQGPGRGRPAGRSLAASEEAVTLCRELVAVNRDAYLPNLAMSVSIHGLHLAEAGRQAEALAAADEAVTLCRELVAVNRDAYLPNLAGSLAMCALVRQELGLERAPAINPARESEALYSSLAETEPLVFDDQLQAVRELINELGTGDVSA